MTLPSHHNRAFTLIEVVISLAITVIILAGIFGVAGAAMDLATMSNRLRLEEMKHNQLCRFLRSSLLQLPPESNVSLSSGVLTVLNAGGTFQWPGSVSQGTRTDLLFENNTLHIVNFHGDAEVSSLRLMEHVTSLAFDLYDPHSRQWVGHVPFHTPIRPTLIRIRYKFVDDSMDRIEVFWVPRFARVNSTPQESGTSQ